MVSRALLNQLTLDHKEPRMLSIVLEFPRFLCAWLFPTLSGGILGTRIH